MRTARAMVLLALLAGQPVFVFAASYRFTPDPVGEKVYSSGQLERVDVPIAILAGGFCAAWLVARTHRHPRKLASDNSQ